MSGERAIQRRAVSCWLEMDIDTEYPALCFDTENGETVVLELDQGAATDLQHTVIEHGIVEPRRYDHSGRKPDDLEGMEAVEQVMEDALGDDYPGDRR